MTHTSGLVFLCRYLKNQGGNDVPLDNQDSHLNGQSTEHHLPALDDGTSQGALHAETPVQAAIYQHSLSPEPGHAEHEHALPGSDLPAALQAMLNSSELQASQQTSQADARQV